MTLITDAVTGGLERALDGVSQRQRVAAHNVANVATPGFTAQQVEFEADLARALAAGRPEAADIRVTPSEAPRKLDGNNVSLESETTELIRSGLQFDTLVHALNHKFNLIRSAIGR